MKRTLLLLFALLVLCPSGAWATSTYFVGGRVAAGDLQTGKKYMIYNTANGSRQYFLYGNGTAYGITNVTLPLSYTTTNDAYLWELETGSTSGTYKIKNVGSSKYSTGGTALGEAGSAKDYTIADYSTCTKKGDGVKYYSADDNSTITVAESITSAHKAVYIQGSGETKYWNGTASAFGLADKAHAYVFYEVIEIADGGCYTIDFVSNNGNTFWALSSSSTSLTVASSASAAQGSVFVAHSYTNLAGEQRWILVNNSDGYYLTYTGATATFNVSNAVNEFTFASINKVVNSYVTSSNCNGKLYIKTDERPTDANNAGCYILRESNAVFNSSDAISVAPYYNGDYTSAMLFTANAASVSAAASLAIAKFDALYATKAVANITALYPAASVSTIVTNINDATTTDAVTTAANAFWTIPNGRKFYAVNSTATGQYMNIGTSQITATATALNAEAVMKVEYASDGKYYLKGVKSGYYTDNPNSGSTNPGTVSTSASATPLYIGNYANTTDNVVYFARAKAGGSATEAIHYNSSYTDQGYVVAWGYDEGASQWNITYITDEEYTSLSSATEETLNYTITDANGATYSGTFTAVLGTTPTFTGCAGYTLSNPAWNISTNTFTANITFPFPISSNSQTNKVYIGSFSSKYISNHVFYWYADGDNITTTRDDYPTNLNHEHFEWLICPSIDNGAISFTLKNVFANKSIYSSKTSNSHDTNATSLEETGSAFTYETYDYSSSVTGFAWKMKTTPTLCLSRVNSDEGSQELGVNSTHLGVQVTIEDNPADFATLQTNLTAATTAFEPYRNKIGSGLGEYSGATSSDMITAYDEAIAATYATATQFTSWTTTLSSPATKLTINQPASGKFYRFKGGNNSKYISNEETSTNSNYKNTDDTDKAIFYLQTNDEKLNLISYATGKYVNTTSSQWAWGLGTANATEITFSQGTDQIGYYAIKSSDIYFYDYMTNYTNSIDRSTALGTDTRSNKWTIEEVTTLPVTFAGEYASFYSPVDLTIPEEDVEVYTGTLNGEWLTLNAVTGTLPANTGVILRRKSSETTTVNFTVLSTVTPGTSALTGTVAAAAAVDGGVLVLGKENDTWGIYKYTGNLGGFKAYMDMPNDPEGEVKGLRFDFGGTATGITAAEVADHLNGAVYNLAGQRVQQPTRGLYIVNGKKVLVK